MGQANSQGHATPRVAALTIYPLKSAAGIPVDHLTLDDRGATGDRRWLLVDGGGTAITARTCHALLHVQPRFATSNRNGALQLEAPRHTTFTAVVPGADAMQRMVQVWDDEVAALDAGDEAAEWCSDAIGEACRLVYLDDDAQRPLRKKYAGPLPHDSRRVAFTDGAPLLLLGLPAVAALNERLAQQGHGERMDRRRFRANVWLDQLAPHEEDRWSAISIGEVSLGVGSRCTRCVLTTVDPDSLQPGTEPLRAFNAYRRTDEGVVFGVNASHAGAGVIRVADPVHVHALKAE